jgi:hypothetical protein
MGKHVDEARRHGMAMGVDLGFSVARQMGCDGGDPVAFHPHIREDRRSAGAIVNLAIADHDIEIFRRRGGRGRQTIKKEEKNFFFEKKKQKTFMFWYGCLLQRAPQETKVFWFFFSKKNAFFLL